MSAGGHHMSSLRAPHVYFSRPPALTSNSPLVSPRLCVARLAVGPPALCTAWTWERLVLLYVNNKSQARSEHVIRHFGRRGQNAYRGARRPRLHVIRAQTKNSLFIATSSKCQAEEMSSPPILASEHIRTTRPYGVPCTPSSPRASGLSAANALPMAHSTPEFRGTAGNVQ